MATSGSALRQERLTRFPSLPMFSQSRDCDGSPIEVTKHKGNEEGNMEKLSRSISFWTMTSLSSSPSMTQESTASSSFDDGSVGSLQSVSSGGKQCSSWFQWLERGLADEARATVTTAKAGSRREKHQSLTGTPAEGIEVFPTTESSLVLTSTSDSFQTSMSFASDDLCGSIGSLGGQSQEHLHSTPPRVKSSLPGVTSSFRYETSSSVEPGTPETDFGSLDYASLHDAFIDALVDEQQSASPLCWNYQSRRSSGIEEGEGRPGGKIERTASEDSIGSSSSSSEGTPGKRFRRRRRGPPGVLSRISARRVQEGEVSYRQGKASGQRKNSGSDDENATPLKKLKARNLRVRSLKRAVSMVERSHDDQSVSSLSNRSTHASETQEQNEWMNVPSSAAYSFLHPECELQKDKGKGESPGSAVCAWERNSTMEKLGQKIDLLKSVSQSSTAMAELKRVKATRVDPQRVCSRGTVVASSDICDTRSMLQMRLGLVSMKYGILLRWDKSCGLVRLVVLRKMCPMSFMDTDGGKKGKCAPKWTVVVIPSRSLSSGLQRSTSLPLPAPPSPTRSRSTLSPPNSPTSIDSETLSAGESDISDDEAAISKGNFSSFMWSRAFDAAVAVLQRGRLSESATGTEVTLLGPPYCIPRPEEFPRPSLSVMVLRASGLRGGKQRPGCVVSPFVTLTLGDQSHTTGVIKISSNPRWTRANKNICRMLCDESMGVNELLKIEILDWRPFRQRGRLLGMTYLPLKKLEAQPDGEGAHIEKWTEITLPCEMKLANQGSPFAFITLSALYRNPREWWIQKELEARKRQNITVHDG